MTSNSISKLPFWKRMAIEPEAEAKTEESADSRRDEAEQLDEHHGGCREDQHRGESAPEPGRFDGVAGEGGQDREIESDDGDVAGAATVPVHRFPSGPG